MIAPGQICCVIEPVDMRRGLESLSQWLQTNLVPRHAMASPMHLVIVLKHD